MRRILFFTTWAFSLLIGSCAGNDEWKINQEKIQRNIEATRVVHDAFKTGDVSRIDSVVAEDFVDHSDRGDVGLDSLKARIMMMHWFYPGMKAEVLRQVADSNYVFTWIRFTGNSKGEIGIPAGPYEVEVIDASLLRDGRIIEHWQFLNMQDLIKYLPPHAPPAPDSAAVTKTFVRPGQQSGN